LGWLAEKQTRRQRRRRPRRAIATRSLTKQNPKQQQNKQRSVNMMSVPKPSDLSTIHDTRAKWAEVVGLSSVQQSTLACVPPLVHVPLPVACRVLYGGVEVQEAERLDHKWQIWSTLKQSQGPGTGTGTGAQGATGAAGARAAGAAGAAAATMKQM
jgi:hypothetical protein